MSAVNVSLCVRVRIAKNSHYWFGLVVNKQTKVDCKMIEYVIRTNRINRWTFRHGIRLGTQSKERYGRGWEGRARWNVCQVWIWNVDLLWEWLSIFDATHTLSLSFPPLKKARETDTKLCHAIQHTPTTIPNSGIDKMELGYFKLYFTSLLPLLAHTHTHTHWHSIRWGSRIFISVVYSLDTRMLRFTPRWA